MPKKLLKRLLPREADLRADRQLRVFGRLLNDRDLWRLNRHSVSVAVAVGLFMAFVPLPAQMLLAAAAAIVLGCNLPIAVATVWVTNPVTMPPIFYATYKLGAWLLDQTPKPIEFELSVRWVVSKLVTVWQPFLLGCMVMGVLSAVAGYFTVRLLWRLHVVRGWRERKQRRARRQTLL